MCLCWTPPDELPNESTDSSGVKIICLFAVTKLTLYVADIQTIQTAIHSMDPTHSHQGHEPKHEKLNKHP